MKKTTVFLREREIKKGISLYLDFYPPIRSPKTMKMTRRESLGIVLYKNPKTESEKNYNKELRAMAEAIKNIRYLSLISDECGFYNPAKLKADFLEYFYSLASKKGDKWLSVYLYFDRYVNSKCSFGNLTEYLCLGFREYLLNTTQLKNKKLPLHHNSAAAYYRLFRATLKQAYLDKCLKTNLNDFIKGIPEKDVFKESLILDEVKLLLFSALFSGHPISL